MKRLSLILLVLTVWRPVIAPAQTSGQYAADIATIIDSQKEAIAQARQALEHATAKNMRAALESAIKEMDRSQKELEAAKSSPEKLSPALAAEQSAYQDLLKATPREYRMRRSRQNQGGGGSGQPNQRELDQLDMAEDNTRYETESQATSSQTAQQKEQSETMDKLKQLARRQQDLNERLRDLQTALQEATNDQERDEIQRQLKRLRDEERQMLSDMDELRQKMEQSPDAGRQAQAQARQQLAQTRNDVQKASQSLDNQAVSEALAAGARAEENLQNLRENLRQQSSSQFAQQLRQMRQQARDLAEHEEKVGQDLDKLAHSDEKSLDDSGPRDAIVNQMARQETALTNLLAQMRNVTEQSEATEPLLSKQLYDIIRQADLAHTDNQLEVGGQLAERGFLPQASQAEQTARQNIDQLRKDVDRAADSVLGSEADALRYAQKQLDTLSSQLAKDLAAGTNNSPAPSETQQNGTPRNHAQNRQARGASQNGQPAQGNDANQTAQASQGEQPGNQSQASPSGKAGQSGQRGHAGQGNPQSANARDANGGNGASDSAASTAETLRDFAKQLGASGGAGGLGENGPITGNNYVDWVERMRDVEQSVDSPEIRNQLATVRERVGVFRRFYRQSGRPPSKDELQAKALAPLTLARDWVAQELARAQNERSLVPLDRDPAPDKYSEMVRKYYENLSSPQ